jgi:hypothetical protein
MNQDEIQLDCAGVCSPCRIEYPAAGGQGDNILFGIDTLNVTVGDYSFLANVPAGSSLVIETELIYSSAWS